MWQDKLKEIIYILENSNVNEIEVNFWGRKYRVVKQAGIVAGVRQDNNSVAIDDINSKIIELKNNGFKMINDKAITGSDGKMVAFIHPSSCAGVLVELVENNT